MVAEVALRKESVDRNNRVVFQFGCLPQSLSARRAWIEMVAQTALKTGYDPVALRKESVDRNSSREVNICIAGKSLSARRAWIEIFFGTRAAQNLYVALRKESVDRNERLQNPIKVQIVSLSARRAWIEMPPITSMSTVARCRSPQGERG